MVPENSGNDSKSTKTIKIDNLVANVLSFT